MIQVAHHQRIDAIVERQHQRGDHRNKAERHDLRGKAQVGLHRVGHPLHPKQRHHDGDHVAHDDQRQRDEDRPIHRIERQNGDDGVGDARGEEDGVFEFDVLHHHHKAELIGQHLNRREQADRRQLKGMKADRADHADHRIGDELQQKDAQELVEHIRLALPLIIRVRLIEAEIRRHRHDGKQRRDAPQLALELRAEKTVGIKRGHQTDEHGQNLGENGEEVVVIRHAADDALDIHGAQSFLRFDGGHKPTSVLYRAFPRFAIFSSLPRLFFTLGRFGA